MVHELSKVVADCGGSISESRMTSLGNEFAMLLLVVSVPGGGQCTLDRYTPTTARRLKARSWDKDGHDWIRTSDLLGVNEALSH